MEQYKVREYEVKLLVTYLDPNDLDEDGQPLERTVYQNVISHPSDQYKLIEDALKPIGFKADEAIAKFECEEDGHDFDTDSYCNHCSQFKGDIVNDERDEYKYEEDLPF